MFSRTGVQAAAVAVLYCVSRVNAQSPAWGQCGGIGWSGATTCVTGYTCTVTNAYYSQCVPGAASATATPTTPATSTSGAASGSSSATSTSTGSTPTGSQIRSDQDPTYHFYLQNSNGAAVLGSEDTSGYFTLGTTISLPSSNGTVYLNVDTTGTASYQTLSFGSMATTTDWGLEGDTIITTNPRQLNFLACATNDPDVYTIFLQTGNDEPSGQTCSLTSLHLDCLC